MLTKTGQLLMRKKNEALQNPQARPSAPDKPQQPQERPQNPPEMPHPRPHHHRTPSHISHVNQYNFISVSNKLTTQQCPIPKEVLQQLQVQNFRLIEENMRLVEWSRTLLGKIRQSIMRVIQGIEEFRYLESVNKLYEVIGELGEHEENGLQLSRFKAKEHFQNLRKLANSNNKAERAAELQARRIYCFTYDPKEMTKKDPPPKIAQKEQPDGRAVVFPLPNMKPDFSNFEPTTSESQMFYMLLLQSLSIETLVDAKMR